MISEASNYFKSIIIIVLYYSNIDKSAVWFVKIFHYDT